MKRIHLMMLAAVALMLAAPHSAMAQRGAPQPKTPERHYLDAMFDNIKGVEIFDCVRLLSDSTLFQGRLSGSEGMRRAVDWVSSRYAEIGLEPLPGMSGYSQDFPTVCTEVTGPCSLSVDGQDCAWATEWYAGGTSANGVADAEVVFAGFGVSAPELGYDDYAGIDVRGKIVLIEGETPNTSRNDDTLRIWYPYTLHQYKVANAVAHGAIGMLYRWVPGPNNGYDPGFVYAYITDELADKLVAGSGRDFQSLIRQLRSGKKPVSFRTGKQARIQMTMTHRDKAVGHNLLGMVKGSDPKLCNEYVVISAHLDHLGIVPQRHFPLTGRRRGRADRKPVSDGASGGSCRQGQVHPESRAGGHRKRFLRGLQIRFAGGAGLCTESERPVCPPSVALLSESLCHASADRWCRVHEEWLSDGRFLFRRRAVLLP